MVIEQGTALAKRGRVIRFDEIRGYGFVAPDDGGDDVFIHANELDGEKWLLGPGVLVEYEAIDSLRGPKALRLRVLPRSGDAGPVPRSVAPIATAAGTPAAFGPIANPALNGPTQRPAAVMAPAAGAAGPVAGATVPPAGAAVPADGDGGGVPTPGQPTAERSADDVMCDVLSEHDLTHEVTETLLRASADLTAGQILAIRQHLVGLARRHSWVEG